MQLEVPQFNVDATYCIDIQSNLNAVHIPILYFEFQEVLELLCRYGIAKNAATLD